jgi:hypothetical protein
MPAREDAAPSGVAPEGLRPADRAERPNGRRRECGEAKPADAGAGV